MFSFLSSAVETLAKLLGEQRNQRLVHDVATGAQTSLPKFECLQMVCEAIPSHAGIVIIETFSAEKVRVPG